MYREWIVVGVLSLSACSLLFQEGEDEYRPSNNLSFSMAKQAQDCTIADKVTWTVGGESIEILDENRVIVGPGPALNLFPLEGASAASVFYCKNFTIEKGGLLLGVGINPIIVIASDTITIAGVIEVGGNGSTSGPGGGMSDGTPAIADFGGAGGSGGSHGSKGGRGTNVDPLVRPVYGVLSLVPLSGGANGGASANGARGGGGGGAIQLSAGKFLTVSGSINAGGGGGGGGGNNVPISDIGRGGGGGGSGGSILLEAPELQLTGFIGVSGGGGGGGSSTAGASSIPGEDATRAVVAKGGDSSPDYKQGGNGAFGATMAMPGNIDLVDNDPSGGGGGGGFGRIRINTVGKTEADYRIGLSPPITHEAVTVGPMLQE